MDKVSGADPALMLRTEPLSGVSAVPVSIGAKGAFDRQLRLTDAILRAVEERGR